MSDMWLLFCAVVVAAAAAASVAVTVCYRV